MIRQVGLSGKSVIPFVISVGCAVPGIMASRTIESERDRRMTIITTTFIPCGAKLPVIAMIAGRLVGGAGEETVVARVGEGIVTTGGSAETHKQVLENPDLISRTVLSKGLDAGTAFEILSIDIADVDVGRNIGAQLQMDQAEADRRIAQAKAEERTIAIGTKLETLTNKLADAVAAGTYAEEELEAIRSLNRKGQFYWDFVFVENSEGAHNSKLTEDCLNKAIKTKALSRALETPVSDETIESIRQAIRETANG